MRSLGAELRDFLSTRRPKTQAEIAGFVERAAAIRAMTPDVPQTPSEELIREMRNSRIER